MVDWNNNELIFLLIFDILALSFAVWWLSRRVKSKIIEVNERKSKRWTREEE
jgi:regulatory protein YycI of two-component signal transduction system YycFG|tara:strand:- start:1589 stop:1744 length:156 start_codon:yes stop_codon:yes gene_type:complete